MADVEQLLSEYIAEHRAGGKADPREYLNRVEGVDRDELAELIDAYLVRSPGQPWDPDAFRGSTAERAAQGLAKSLLGASGWWPAVLPQMRDRARLTRKQVVARLARELGVAEREEKVRDYYHAMEQGRLDSRGVSQRVLDALGKLYGLSGEALRRLGEPLGAVSREGETPPAFARIARPDPEYGAPPTAPREDGARAEPVAPAEWDEVDELFRGERG